MGKIPYRYLSIAVVGVLWLVGQAAKTPPFHGSNGSSILPRVTKYVGMMELADLTDSKPVALSVWVRVPLPTPERRLIFSLFPTTLFKCYETSVYNGRLRSSFLVREQGKTTQIKYGGVIYALFYIRTCKF